MTHDEPMGSGVTPSPDGEPDAAAQTLDPGDIEPANRCVELSDQTTALRAHARESTEQLGELAERVAQAADEAARLFDHIATTADPATASRVREHAERARRFAEHERREAQRWATQARHG